jgi:hypothetical protein
MNPYYSYVSSRAFHRCEYCRAPEVSFNLPFEVEHITPRSQLGDTTAENLALACRSCNLYKAGFVSSPDPESATEVRLFNPRIDDWVQHFSVSRDTALIKGLTAVGRATIVRLRMNSRLQIEARKCWLQLNLLEGG